MTDENAVVKSKAVNVTIGVVDLKEVSAEILAKKRELYAEENWPDIQTPKGRDWFKRAVADTRGLRVGTDNFRKQEKAPFYDHLKLVETTCQDAIESIREIENPLKAKLDEENERLQEIKDAEEKANQDRISKITVRINAIRESPIEALDMKSEAIMERIEELKLIDPTDPDEGFDEFVASTEDALHNSIEKLQNIYDKTVLAEQQKIENAARETKRLEDEEKTRLANVEAERVRKEGIAKREEENRIKAAELAEREKQLNEKLAELNPNKLDYLHNEQTVTNMPERKHEEPLIDEPESDSTGDLAEKVRPSVLASIKALFELIDGYYGDDLPSFILCAIQEGKVPNIIFQVQE